jgi:hypothetical protein
MRAVIAKVTTSGYLLRITAEAASVVIAAWLALKVTGSEAIVDQFISQHSWLLMKTSVAFVLLCPLVGVGTSMVKAFLEGLFGVGVSRREVQQ